MNRKISELVKINQAFAPVDIATDQTGAYVSMEDYRQVQAVLTTDTVAATKNVTIQLMQAQDSSGTGAKVLGDVVTAVAGAGGEKITLSVEANASALDEGFTHVTAVVTSDTATALLGAAIIVRANGRYGTDRP